MLSEKNFSLGPAATDLGLGDMGRMQLDDEMQERKKKLLQSQKIAQGQPFGPATLSLFGLGTSGGATSGLLGG